MLPPYIHKGNSFPEDNCSVIMRIPFLESYKWVDGTFNKSGGSFWSDSFYSIRRYPTHYILSSDLDKLLKEWEYDEEDI